MYTVWGMSDLEQQVLTETVMIFSSKLYWSHEEKSFTLTFIGPVTNLIVHPAVPGPLLSSNQRSILPCFMLVYFVTAFELWELEFFWKINLDRTVGIHSNNLDHKRLSDK